MCIQPLDCQYEKPMYGVHSFKLANEILNVVLNIDINHSKYMLRVCSTVMYKYEHTHIQGRHDVTNMMYVCSAKMMFMQTTQSVLQSVNLYSIHPTKNYTYQTVPIV